MYKVFPRNLYSTECHIQATWSVLKATVQVNYDMLLKIQDYATVQIVCFFTIDPLAVCSLVTITGYVKKHLMLR